jgi:hypothetical protein
MEITFGCNTLCESEKPTKEKTSMKQFSMLFFVLYPICSMYGTIRTHASWSVEERRSGLMAGEKHGIEDDFSCPIPDAILSEAAEIVSKRFKFDEANLHSANLGDVRIPQKNSHGGHRFPGRGDNLHALKWARKRLSSTMEYGMLAELFAPRACSLLWRLHSW